MKYEAVSLGEALPMEIKEKIELLLQYVRLGPNGAFGAAVIKVRIEAALNALAKQDNVEMLRSYDALRHCK